MEELFPNFIEMMPESMHNRIKSPRFTAGTLYRLLIDRVLSADVEKVIYLDSDIIVNLNIKELWQIELKDHPIAAVTLFDNSVENKRNEPVHNVSVCKAMIVNPKDYLNDGVLVINLKKLRAEGSILNWGKLHVPAEYLQFADGTQQYFNICFSAESLKLPTKFNSFVYYLRDGGVNNIERRIYHYVEGNTYRGLRLDVKDVFSRLFFKYFMMTPWFTEDTLGNIFDALRQIYVERQAVLIKISEIFVGKRRAFVTVSPIANKLKKIFSIKENEDLFSINDQHSLQDLIMNMKKSVGEKIFIIFTGGIYPQLHAILTQAGLVEGRDFINGEIFLSEVHGVQLNLYSLTMKI